jgi:hypothetical protein
MASSYLPLRAARGEKRMRQRIDETDALLD